MSVKYTDKVLTVDIGNSQICIGIYLRKKLEGYWRIKTDPKETEDELKIILTNIMQIAGIKFQEMEGAIVASVVPPLTDPMVKSLEKLIEGKVIVVNPGIKTGISILMDNPKEVGADRIVNAVAASIKYPGGSIVVDLGTATTFDCISPKSEYLGGAIAPGISISSEALFLRAAKLPRIEISKPGRCIGKNTVESMQSGIFYGYVGLIDGMVERLKGELNFPVKVIATGGFAQIIAGESRSIDIIDPTLTLDGLAILYEKNSSYHQVDDRKSR